MTDSKPVKTPITISDDAISKESDEECNINFYQEIVGELLYIANRTRPDIAFVISYLSQ